MKTKYGCDTVQATCVEYQTQLPTFSEIDGCPSLDDTTTELYDLIEGINTENDLTALGNLCLSYTTIGGKKIVKNVLLKLEQEICSLKTEVNNLKTTAICTTPITQCNFELGNLVDPCGEQPQTLGALVQILINKHITP